MAVESSKIAALIHAERLHEAAQYLSDELQLGLKLKDDNPEKFLPVLQYYLHDLLENGEFSDAAKLLWKPNQFTPEPQSVKDLWQLFDESDMGLIMGGGALGKSFSIGVRLMLEWIRDPEWTSIRVVGPSEAHLEENLFSHLVGLHRNASLPMPGEVGALFIGLDRRNQLSSIRGIVIPKGNVKKAGRLQGGHRKPRPEPHPKFGKLSRLFIFIDEIENVPAGIFKDIDNVLSDVKKDDAGGFKIFGAYNPTDPMSEVGKRAEPTFGWQSLDDRAHFRWKSIRGWDVLRLDGERCENVIEGREIFAGLQTREGLEAIARNGGGINSPGYRSMGRGLYPDVSAEVTIFPPGMIPKIRGEYIWYNTPVSVGACDLALEGKASAIYTLGKFGLATGMKFPPSLEFPEGRTIMFKDRTNSVVARYGLLVEQQFTLPKGDTVAMKDKIIALSKKAGVRPEYFSIDRTGAGAGTADLIKYEWSSAIHDLNYSIAASKEKLMIEDSKTCEELYDRAQTELWFAARAWAEFGYMLLHPQLSLEKLSEQLTKRRSKLYGTRSKVEAKREYSLRTGLDSPDEVDSLTLIVYAARKGSGVVLSMKGDPIDIPGVDGDDWFDYYPNGTRIDVSNRADYLDREERDLAIL